MPEWWGRRGGGGNKMKTKIEFLILRSNLKIRKIGYFGVYVFSSNLLI